MQYNLFVSCPKGLEYLLETEVKSLGLQVDRVSPQGVFGVGTLSTIYHLCLWSRLANRVQLILFAGEVATEGLIAQLCREFHWQTVFSSEHSFAVSFHGVSPQIRNTMYGAQLVKDGVVDYFRQLKGVRPSVDKAHPDIHIHAYLKDDHLTVSLDLSGGSLHQRGYRLDGGEAPIKENVAAALLIRAGWSKWIELGGAFHDPFCGSGTLVIEAAMMAANIAPGILRSGFGWTHWLGHDESLWNKIKQEALDQVKPVTLQLLGSDVDQKNIQSAKRNAERAGVAKLVSFAVNPLDACEAPAPQGVLLCNPPYGERLGEMGALLSLYQSLGHVLHTQYAGWEAGVLTLNDVLAKAIGLRAHKQYAIQNGALPCRLYLFHLDKTNRLNDTQLTPSEDNITMLVNRLTKNGAHLAKWAKRLHIEAYRLYDADLSEYAFAVDRYLDNVVLQEYMPPETVSITVAEKRRLEMIQAVIKACAIPVEKLVIKQRKQQKGQAQYEKHSHERETLTVHEGAAKLIVNLRDYLDTGLFLDHRPLRFQFGQLPKGAKFLNLFCYTATASVHAALAGALTTNVDMSKTYLRWAEDNFRANQLHVSQHQFIAMDVKKWFQQARQRYDVIFLDPPTFSNSKRMEESLDTQRDHVWLIDEVMRLLAENGVLYFSTNLRRFRLDAELSERYTIQDITPQTIDVDFKRQPKVHKCFKIAHSKT
ncbi:MAG: bifunctional 23S rRNA (guanine(2069)-N(7))-methyltransferase RlmK/23S rRNA (guanine(2445)-N(2))-methyltransferase RlmL [Gammaproteobacteria bacterium]|nr:bifunctional 23S rRNA (guanine(2069)-N(7))-methyltransferase RlmK/23S rRNA (guanine(2445)-N(2))-methyltransferase RlmL [Gammaproteobacteria bacterium]